MYVATQMNRKKSRLAEKDNLPLFFKNCHIFKYMKHRYVSRNYINANTFTMTSLSSYLVGKQKAQQIYVAGEITSVQIQEIPWNVM